MAKRSQQTSETKGTTDAPSPADPSASQSAPPNSNVRVEPKIGLYGGVVVLDRIEFGKLVISLIHGYGNRYTSHGLPSYLMKMFGLATREEAVDVIHQLQASNKGEKE
jgi:hypothetical protein